MKKYPITAARDYYRGRDARRLRKQQEFNPVVGLIERHINALIAQWPDDHSGSIDSYLVASAIGESSDLVHEVIFQTDGGSGGITIYKGDYDRATAPSK